MHDYGVNQEPPEHSCTNLLAGNLEDEVELNHFQADGDELEPILELHMPSPRIVNAPG